MYNRFEEIMSIRGLTAYKVSKATGIAQSTFSDWKSGKSVPKSDKIKKIANFLEVSDRVFSEDTIVTCPYCELSYSPCESEDVKKHEKRHLLWKNAVEKFGFCWAYEEREVKKAIARSKNKDIKLTIEERLEHQLTIFKALFSRSLSSNEYDLNHPTFDEYIGMLLNNETLNTVPNDLQQMLIKQYGKQEGISRGTIFGAVYPQKIKDEPTLKVKATAPFAAYGKKNVDFTQEEVTQINKFIDFVIDQREKKE